MHKNMIIGAGVGSTPNEGESESANNLISKA
jgi:hypothetical protein